MLIAKNFTIEIQMWNWNKTDKYKTDKEKILDSFPKILKRDVENVLDVLPFESYILLSDGQYHEVENLVHPVEQEIVLDGEILKIPSRVYFNEPGIEAEKSLTVTQQTILNCIYLKHHNGFLRQRRLKQLLDETDYFVIPFTFQLLGEYLIEILEVLDKHINAKTIADYSKFIKENPKYWQKTESRMISYWNEYYRNPRFPKLKDYIGQQIVNRIKKRLLNSRQ